MVFDYLDDDLLSLSKKGKLDISVVKSFAKAILQALAFIHAKGYVHLGMFFHRAHFGFLTRRRRQAQ